jgi:hypothetical protein
LVPEGGGEYGAKVAVTVEEPRAAASKLREHSPTPLRVTSTVQLGGIAFASEIVTDPAVAGAPVVVSTTVAVRST